MTDVNQPSNISPLGMEKSRFEKISLQLSLKELSEWLSIYVKVCRDLATPSALGHPSSNNSKTCNNLWKHFNRQTEFSRSSNRSRQDQRTNSSNSFQPSSGKLAVCQNNVSCQYFNKCSHFPDLSPLERREHVRKLKLRFNCFELHHVQQCTSINVCRS